MFFNEFAEGNAHGLFHNARPVHMPADLKELCALVIIAPKTGKPRRPTPENGGRNSDRFNIVDGGWTTIKTGACGKWRLQARLDRKSVVSGKSVSGRVDLGGRRIIKKK